MFNNMGNSMSWSFFASKVASKGMLKSEIYTIEMFGNDGRAIVFDYKNKTCMALAISNGGGLTCWEKDK